MKTESQLCKTSITTDRIERIINQQTKTKHTYTATFKNYQKTNKTILSWETKALLGERR